MRILLVEDDDRIADPLAEDLRHQSNAVDIAYDGLAGWEFDQISGEQTIKTHLTNLRRKLKQAGCQQDIIETVYGVGYRLGNS